MCRKIKKYLKDNQLQLYLFVILVIILVLIIFSNIDSKTIIGLLGVLIGSLITTFSNLYIQKIEFKRKLSLAALEKRLEAHQKAYSRWKKIMNNIFKDDDRLNEIISESQEWWNDNCLYLGPRSRESFFNCLIFAANHKNLVNARKHSEEYKKEIKESWKIIIKPGIDLVEEVALPTFSEEIKIPGNE